MSENIGLEDFELLSRVDGGGAGDVYRATPKRDLDFASVGEILAVKLYRPEILSEPNQLARIQQEFATGALLRHENLIRIFHVDTTASQPFLVMEWVDGDTLQSWRIQNPAIDDDQLMSIVTQLLDVVEFLHSTRRLHRDVKPANLKIDSLGRVRLLDYGIIRSFREGHLTQSGGKFVGTIRYAAPEYLYSSDLGYAADLYSVGAVVHFLLHGKEIYPTFTSNLELYEHKRQNDAYVPPLVGASAIVSALDAISKQMLARRPADRPISALACLNQLAGKVAEWVPFRVYFASALTKVDELARQNIVNCGKAMQQAGNRHGYSVYLPVEHTDPRDMTKVSGSEVYWVDRERVASSDLMVLFADEPSFGAGQEAEIACNAGVPVLLVSKKGMRISKMLQGAPARILGEIQYDDANDLSGQAESFFESNRKRMKLWRDSREREYHSKLGRRIAARRAELNLDLESVASKATVPAEAIRSLETRPEAQASISIVNLRRLASALDISPAELLKDQSEDEQRFEDLWRESLHSLRDMCSAKNLTYEHYAVLKTRGWKALKASTAQAKAARGSLSGPFTQTWWLKEFTEVMNSPASLLDAMPEDPETTVT